MIHGWRQWLDRLSIAFVYGAGLAAGGVTLHFQRAATQSRWLDWASTNLSNMRDHPVSAMVFSALLPGEHRGAWVLLALVGIGTTGWALGAWRTALLVGAAHVLGTVISEGILWYRIAAGAVPAAQEHIRDVGPSYVVMAGLVAGVLLDAGIARLACALGFALIAPGSFTGLSQLEVGASGHASATLIAIVLAWILSSPSRNAAAEVTAPQPHAA